MKMDELDDILLYDKKVEPSTSFTRNVMAQIGSETSIHRSIPFPWIPFSVCILAVALLSFWFFPADSFVTETKAAIQAFNSWILTAKDTGFGRPVQYLFFSLTGSLILIWLALRLADENR